MRIPLIIIVFMAVNVLAAEAQSTTESVPDSMLIRISEIEVYPQYLQEYLSFAKNVGEISVREEPGVICIYPMTQLRDSCQVRIFEIYRDMEAYRRHIQTPHFLTYKKGTLHMVKSLDLVDMKPMDPSAMGRIFTKMNE